VKRAVTASIAALMLLSSTAHADEQRPEEPKKESRLFGRFGAGYERGQLFLGSSDPRPDHGVPLLAQLGGRFSESLAGSGELVFTPGASDHGISMYRVALGASLELRQGPVFFSFGPHAVWFGASRKSSGRAGSGFVDEEPLLWRVGPGAHAMLGIDVPVARGFGVFAGVRGDVDALLSLSPMEAAPNGSVLGVLGVSFR
jgi:hypothetical protein